MNRLARDFETLGRPWALIGGLAVSIRAEQRTTRDLDVVVGVENDREAEGLLADLRAQGYRVYRILEREPEGDFLSAHLISPESDQGELIIDVIFGLSGIESEIVDNAEGVELIDGLTVPVAALGDLIALKTLAGRRKDLIDLEGMLRVATSEDLERARRGLVLILERGRGRGRSLLRELDEHLADANPEDPTV